jgi:hypothetical protein
MAKTHVLRVVTADGIVERKVDGTERLILKAGGAMTSYPVKELSSVLVDELGGEGGRVLVVDANGRGRYAHVAASARFELGEDRWQVSALMAFRLALIPPKQEEPPAPRVVRVSFEDGRQPVDVYSSGAQITGTPVGMSADTYERWGAPLDDVAGLEVLELVEAVR